MDRTGYNSALQIAARSLEVLDMMSPEEVEALMQAIQEESPALQATFRVRRISGKAA